MRSKHLRLAALQFDQNSVRGSCSRTGRTRSTPRIALFRFLLAVAVARRNPPDLVFKRIPMTARALCDPSLPSNWYNDPPQEIRAPMQNLLHDSLPLIVCHHPRPRLELRLSLFTNSDHSPAFPTIVGV